MLRRLTTLCLALLPALSIAAAASARQAGRVETDRWYVLLMQGRRVGHMHESTRLEEGVLRSRMSMEMTIGRGDAEVSLTLSGEFVETPDHEPLSMRSAQALGSAPAEKHYEFDGDTVRLSETQGGRTTTRTLPAPEGDWLTPAAAAEAFQRRVDAGETAFTITSIDPLSGLQPIETTYTVKERTNVEAFGKVVPALEAQMRSSAQPGVVTTIHTDDAGQVVRSETQMGGLTLTVLLSEKEIALSPVEPVELVASTLVTPSREIPRPRGTKRASYLLTGAEAIDLPDAAAQRVERVDDGRLRVTVDVDRRPRAPREEVEDPAYLASTSAVDAEDPEIVSLMRRALDGVEGDGLRRAEALRRHIHHYIDEKNLSVGFATASEVCRTRQGDCTEHAVLLAATLRGAGIPSRVATGLIYAEQFVGRRGIFGYHMWTQALVPVDGTPTWIDLDATLPDATPFDAAHIALDTSALGEGDTLNAMASVASVLGALGVEVVEIER